MSEPTTDHLKTLEPLLGTWQVVGPTTSGTVRYHWAEFGGWLIQDIDVVTDDQPTRGVEYIGYDNPTDSLRSHFFGGSGELLEYTYSLDGSVLTIWFGGPESPARFTGTFNDDFTENVGAWTWPGGGYDSTMIRKSER